MQSCGSNRSGKPQRSAAALSEKKLVYSSNIVDLATLCELFLSLFVLYLVLETTILRYNFNHFHAEPDPDPSFNFNAYPDPAFHSRADPYPWGSGSLFPIALTLPRLACERFTEAQVSCDSVIQLHARHPLPLVSKLNGRYTRRLSKRGSLLTEGGGGRDGRRA
jgi:hypothetical protein